MCRHDKLASISDLRKFLNYLVLQGSHSPIPPEIRCVILTQRSQEDLLTVAYAPGNSLTWIWPIMTDFCFYSGYSKQKKNPQHTVLKVP